MANYTDQATIEAYLKRTLTAYEVTLLATANPAVKQFIDAYCNRVFSDDGSSVRYYDGVGGRELFIDEFRSISSIEYIDDEGDNLLTLETNDYVTYPINGSSISSLVMRAGRWTPGLHNIKITGVMGQASVPESIKMVATQLVANLFNNPKNLTSRSIEGYSETYGKLLDEPNRNLLDANTRPML